MGAFDKHKKEIKRDLKRQRTDLAKAKKLAEALVVHLEGVEGRLNQTELVVESIRGTDMDTALKLMNRKNPDSPQVQDQLQELAARIIANPPNRYPQPRIMKSTLPKRSTIGGRTLGIRTAVMRGASRRTSGVATRGPRKASGKSAGVSKGATSKATKRSSGSAAARSTKAPSSGRPSAPLMVGWKDVPKGDEDEDMDSKSGEGEEMETE